MCPSFVISLALAADRTSKALNQSQAHPEQNHQQHVWIMAGPAPVRPDARKPGNPKTPGFAAAGACYLRAALRAALRCSASFASTLNIATQSSTSSPRAVTASLMVAPIP